VHGLAKRAGRQGRQGRHTVSADTIITRITEAGTPDEALAILERVSRARLEQVADLLYVDTWGMGPARIRSAILAEARA